MYIYRTILSETKWGVGEEEREEKSRVVECYFQKNINDSCHYIN
jgi:hypothetical protein